MYHIVYLIQCSGYSSDKLHRLKYIPELCLWFTRIYAFLWVLGLSLHLVYLNMGVLPETQNSGLRMRRGCRERFPRHRFHSKLLVSDPDMHHVTHVPWCMSGSLNRGDGRNVPACATRNFTYLARGPLLRNYVHYEVWDEGTIHTQTSTV